MMIKKMIAAMSAVAIMGTSAAYNRAHYSFFPLLYRRVRITDFRGMCNDINYRTE